jgi:hypothetical protein
MKKFSLISVAAVFLAFLISFNSISSYTSNVVVEDDIVLTEYSLDTDLTLYVEFFGYDTDVLNLTEI